MGFGKAGKTGAVCTSGDLLKGVDVWDKAGPVFQPGNEHLVQQLRLRPVLESVLTHVHQDYILCASLPDGCATTPFAHIAKSEVEARVNADA